MRASVLERGGGREMEMEKGREREREREREKERERESCQQLLGEHVGQTVKLIILEVMYR